MLVKVTILVLLALLSVLWLIIPIMHASHQLVQATWTWQFGKIKPHEAWRWSQPVGGKKNRMSWNTNFVMWVWGQCSPAVRLNQLTPRVLLQYVLISHVWAFRHQTVRISHWSSNWAVSGEIAAVVGNISKSLGVKNALVMAFVFQTPTSPKKSTKI